MRVAHRLFALHVTVLLPLAVVLPSTAAEPRPEIVRAVAKSQPVGLVHTLRTIPEACARIEGVFTGQAEAPYRFTVARTSSDCQPRARLVDAAKAKPSPKAGWIFNDLIRVPSASCPSQQAVVRVWRKPGQVATPALDAQGRARIYLQDAQKAAPTQSAQAPIYAAAMTVEGTPCQ